LLPMTRVRSDILVIPLVYGLKVALGRFQRARLECSPGREQKAWLLLASSLPVEYEMDSDISSFAPAARQKAPLLLANIVPMTLMKRVPPLT
jgi:hypothetical protein